MTKLDKQGYRKIIKKFDNLTNLKFSDCTLSEVMTYLQELQEEYTQKGFKDLRINSEEYYSNNFVLTGERVETDTEFNVRIKRTEKTKARLKE